MWSVGEAVMRMKRIEPQRRKGREGKFNAHFVLVGCIAIFAPLRFILRFTCRFMIRILPRDGGGFCRWRSGGAYRAARKVGGSFGPRGDRARAGEPHRKEPGRRGPPALR